jgi:hypothetical protein
VHCANGLNPPCQSGRPARGFQPTWPFSPRPRSRGALVVGTPWWRRPGRLRPAGGDGRWGTPTRAQGGAEGPILEPPIINYELITNYQRLTIKSIINN